MPKGPEKNTKNKALHTKLLNRKKAKLQEEKAAKAARLKALVIQMNQQKTLMRLVAIKPPLAKFSDLLL